MKCPFCGHPNSRVIDSRSTDNDTKNQSIRRRRECGKRDCHQRWTTYETKSDMPIGELHSKLEHIQRLADELLNTYI